MQYRTDLAESILIEERREEELTRIGEAEKVLAEEISKLYRSAENQR